MADTTENKTYMAEKLFKGPLNPEKLRLEFQMAANSVKDEAKMLEFIRTLPNVVSVEILNSNEKKRTRKVTVMFKANEDAKRITAGMLFKCDHARLNARPNSNHYFLMKRPFCNMGGMLRNELSIMRFYLKAFKDDQNSTIDR